VRLEEPVPIKVKQGIIPLNIESYQAFQMVARATIKHMKMKKKKDPNAGRPIIGTPAARQLDPVRNRQGIQAANRATRSESARTNENSGSSKAKQTTKARNKSSEPKVASDPAGDSGDGT
jgi:hypothetical protein